MNSSFGPNSSNPRVRRSYAHAKRDEAIRSGLAQDKIDALEAAKAAISSKKGESLGRQALSAFRNASSVKMNENPTKFRDMHTSGTFNSETMAHAKQLISDIDGSELGVSVNTYKPESIDEYVKAFRRIDAQSVHNMQGAVWADGTPADVPSSNDAIQNGAEYNFRDGAYVAEIRSTHDTSNFYRTLDAVTKPHAH